MTKWQPKPKNYVKFYYATEPNQAGLWGVWVREFTDATCDKPVTQMTLIETYDSGEEAKEAACEFQTVSN